MTGRRGNQHALVYAKINNVIYIERNINMLKKDLIFRNPLRAVGEDAENILPEGGFGAVLARAGVGKTALLVQLALDSLLQDKKVLHISLSDPVKKVSLWYEEVFKNISGQYDARDMNQLWEAIMPGRLIMTFNLEAFSVPKLEERLTDLTAQNIFRPHMILIDGLPFEGDVRESLEQLQVLARNENLRVWLTVRTHRHEPPDEAGIPIPLSDVADLFNVAFELQPEGKNIYIKTVKGGSVDAKSETIVLDPSTMLISKG